MSAHPPHVVLRGRRLETLDLMLGGLLGAVDGYRLPGDAPYGWPVVPHLNVDRRVADEIGASERIELRDPDTTALAELEISQTRDDGEHVWLAGALRRLRPPEHGPARSFRPQSGLELSGHDVALFGGSVEAADLLRLQSSRSARPIVLVVAGDDDPARSAALVHEIERSAEAIGDARVIYLPATDLSGPDVPRTVLAGLGAADVMDARHPIESSATGAVVLFTGLSGSGKSTVARALADSLNASGGRRAVLLDGDDVRAELSSELGFSAEDRDRNLKRQAWVGARVAEAGGIAICAPIAPFAASRAAMRAKVEPQSPLILIYVSTPLEVAETRDRKGLYAKARAGIIRDFTGIDSPYEVPLDADLVIDASMLSVHQCVDEIEALLKERGLLAPG